MGFGNLVVNYVCQGKVTIFLESGTNLLFFFKPMQPFPDNGCPYMYKPQNDRTKTNNYTQLICY